METLCGSLLPAYNPLCCLVTSSWKVPSGADFTGSPKQLVFYPCRMTGLFSAPTMK